jgi:hypothetical protein
MRRWQDMKQQPLTQPFNDGVLKVYSVGNIAEPGDLAKSGLTLKFQNAIPYEERTVGITRFYSAKQDQNTIEQLLRIPRMNGISRNDVVIPIDGEQYRIEQVQSVKDVEPHCLDLSLERVSVAYDIKVY